MDEVKSNMKQKHIQSGVQLKYGESSGQSEVSPMPRDATLRYSEAMFSLIHACAQAYKKKKHAGYL